MFNRFCTLVGIVALGASFAFFATPASAQVGSAFNYQGRLANGSSAITTAVDLRFSLFDAPTSGTQQGSDIVVANMAYDGGIVQLPLDFGGASFNGTKRWLEIEVRDPADLTDTAPYTILTPRVELLPTPHALTAQKLTGENGEMIDNSADNIFNLSNNDNNTALQINLESGVLLKAADASSGDGDALNIQAASSGTGNGGGITLLGGEGGDLASGGDVAVIGGTVGVLATSGSGGDVLIEGGGGFHSGDGGELALLGGDSVGTGATATGAGGDVRIQGGDAAESGDGGDILLLPGADGILGGAPGIVDVAGQLETDAFRIPTGAGTGLVLTSDASGNAAWQTAPGAGSADGNSLDSLNGSLVDQVVVQNTGETEFKGDIELQNGETLNNATDEILRIQSDSNPQKQLQIDFDTFISDVLITPGSPVSGFGYGLEIHAGDGGLSGVGDESGGSIDIRAGTARTGNAFGGALNLLAGGGAGTRAGGDVQIIAGSAGFGGASGGEVFIKGGFGAGSGDGGTILIQPGQSSDTGGGTAGKLSLLGGSGIGSGAFGATGAGGNVEIIGGDSRDPAASAGDVIIEGGTPILGAAPGDVSITAGAASASSNDAGADTAIAGGDGDGTGDGGDISLTPGSATGTGNDGIVDVVGLIETDGFRLPTGAGFNSILASDVAGNATWRTSNSLGLGDSHSLDSQDGTLIDQVFVKNSGTVEIKGDLELEGNEIIRNVAPEVIQFIDSINGDVLQFSLISGAELSSSAPSSGNAGDFSILAANGPSAGTGNAGQAILRGGDVVAPAEGDGGNVRITGGNGGASDGMGGGVLINGGDGGATDGWGGSVLLQGGQPSGTGFSGDIRLFGANAGSADTKGGEILAIAGNASGTNDGGDVVLSPGPALGTGNDGIIRANGDVRLEGGETLKNSVPGVVNLSGPANGLEVILGAASDVFLRLESAGSNLTALAGSADTGAPGNGGAMDLRAGNAFDIGDGGVASLVGGNGGGNGGDGGRVVLLGGATGDSGQPGGVLISGAGSNLGSNQTGGEVRIRSGFGEGTGNGADIILDPGNAMGTGNDGVIRAGGTLILENNEQINNTFNELLIFTTDSALNDVALHMDFASSTEMVLKSPDAAAGNALGINLAGGASPAGEGGHVTVAGGATTANLSQAGNLNLNAGSSTGLNSDGGSVAISGGDTGFDGNGGSVAISGGEADNGSSGDADGGNITLDGGIGHGIGDGGDINLTPGSVTGTGAPGIVDVTGLLETDNFRLPTGAGPGLVLTSDGSGNGTWQAGGGGGAGDGHSLNSANGLLIDQVFVTNGGTTEIMGDLDVKGGDIILLQDEFITNNIDGTVSIVDNSIPELALDFILGDGIVIGSRTLLSGEGQRLQLVAASGSGFDSNGGGINLTSGDATGAGEAGEIIISSGNADFGSNNNGGNVNINTGTGGAGGSGGSIKIAASTESAGTPGDVQVEGGSVQIASKSAGLKGSSITITEGSFEVETKNGGGSFTATDTSVMVMSGDSSTTGTGGNVMVKSKPDANGDGGSIIVESGTMTFTADKGTSPVTIVSITETMFNTTSEGFNFNSTTGGAVLGSFSADGGSVNIQAESVQLIDAPGGIPSGALVGTAGGDINITDGSTLTSEAMVTGSTVTLQGKGGDIITGAGGMGGRVRVFGGDGDGAGDGGDIVMMPGAGGATGNSGTIQAMGDLVVTSGSLTLGSGGTPVSTILHGSAVIDMPPTPPGLSSDGPVVITVIGAQDGDAVSLGVPAAEAGPGLIYFAHVSAPGQVTVRLFNASGGFVDPLPAPFNVTVIRH